MTDEEKKKDQPTHVKAFWLGVVVGMVVLILIRYVAVGVMFDVASTFHLGIFQHVP